MALIKISFSKHDTKGKKTVFVKLKFMFSTNFKFNLVDHSGYNKISRKDERLVKEKAWHGFARKLSTIFKEVLNQILEAHLMRARLISKRRRNSSHNILVQRLLIFN